MEGSTHPPIRSTRPVCEPCDRSTRPTSPNPVGSASDGRMFISDDDLRLGHPSLRPEIEVCYLSRSEEMDTEEECLRHALLAVAPGGHPNIPDLPPRASCSSSPRNDPETRRCGPGASPSVLPDCSSTLDKVGSSRIWLPALPRCAGNRWDPGARLGLAYRKEDPCFVLLDRAPRRILRRSIRHDGSQGYGLDR